VLRSVDVASKSSAVGGAIREIFHPSKGLVKGFSVVEVWVEPGGEVKKHFHRVAEEVCFVLEGVGSFLLGGEKFLVRAGDYVYIAAGVKHKVKNVGRRVLKLLCLSVPECLEGDTVLAE